MSKLSQNTAGESDLTGLDSCSYQKADQESSLRSFGLQEALSTREEALSRLSSDYCCNSTCSQIVFKNLIKYYGKTQVLSDISLEIPRGTIYGLVGHSGAGKSTLLRTINGLESFSSGNLYVDSVDVSRLHGTELREFRKNIGMIFQHFSLMARQNVFDNVALPLRCWGFEESEIKKRVSRLLDLVGLADKHTSYPSALSGGQKQRVAIARALSLEPKILLSDEATSALDPSMTQSILDLLSMINRELGVTIVLVTHEMEVVKKLCHYAAFLEGGRVAESGDIEELFLQPRAAMRGFLTEGEVLPRSGVNIRLFFPKEVAQNPIITQMARKLELDFSIVWGKLERFGDDVLGSLVINIPLERLAEAERFLTQSGVLWEVIDG